MSYCFHCMTKIDDKECVFCPECGRKYNVHYAQSHELPAGTTLCDGRYFVGKSIGEGGFSVTYIGCDTKMNRKVVIKETFYRDAFYRNCLDKTIDDPLEVLYGSDVSLDEIAAKTGKECRSLTEADSLSNIVKVYDWFTENNTAYIVMEYISGETMRDTVSENGAYDWEQLYTKLKPLMQSLSVLHKKGVIHRDIKPNNIMIRNVDDENKEFVLIDFGLARSKNAHTLGTAGISFTPGFAPYEQRFFTEYDGTYTDVYSLAATIYYALSGDVPEKKIGENVEDNFPKLNELVFSGKIPKSAGMALNKALQPDYIKRCQTIDEFINIIEDNNQETKISFAEQDVNVPSEIKISSAKKDVDLPSEINSVPSRRIEGESPQQQNNDDEEIDPKPHTGKGLKSLMIIVIILIALPLLALGGYVVYNYYHPVQVNNESDSNSKKYEHYTEMPSVVGLSLDRCRLVLDDDKFEIEVREFSAENMDAGTVAKQEPAAGERVTAVDGEKYEVCLYVAADIDSDEDGYVLSPNCMDKQLEDAVKLCEDLGLEVDYYYESSSDDIVGNVVVYQSPMYGEYISKDVPMTLIVCKGKDASHFFKIDDYFGLKYSDVKKELEEAGWTVKSIEEERSDYNEGLIIGQSIEKGSAVDIEEENEITFYVAKEPKKSTSSNSSKKSSDK